MPRRSPRNVRSFQRVAVRPSFACPFWNGDRSTLTQALALADEMTSRLGDLSSFQEFVGPPLPPKD